MDDLALDVSALLRVAPDLVDLECYFLVQGDDDDGKSDAPPRVKHVLEALSKPIE